MPRGVVRWFNSSKGFGFIETEKTGVEVYFHRSKIVAAGDWTIAEGDWVEFEVDELRNGLRAKGLRKLNLTHATE